MNKKTNPAFQLWDILYPIGIYYVVIACAMYVLQGVMGAKEESYMIRQILASLVAFPVIFSFYRYDRVMGNYLRLRFLPGRRTGICAAGLVVCAAFLSVGLNNAIALTPLMKQSEAFRNASANFFGGRVLFEVIGAGFFVPVLEELLFRGVVYQRGRKHFGRPAAAILSALLFALLHFNLVQGIYAFCLGIVLAYAVELTGHFCGAVIVHITANLLAVLRQETGCMDWMTEGGVLSSWALAIGLVLCGCAILDLLKRRLPAQKEK